MLIQGLIMKKNIVFLLVSLMLSASSYAVDGVIHFRGEIVSPTCEIKTNLKNETMDTSCYKNGKMVKASQSIYATSLNAETPVKTILMPVKNHENLKVLVVQYE